MKLPCSVIRDLLPVYTEKLTEPETGVLVEEHLRDCPACRTALDALCAEAAPPVETAQPLSNLKRQLRLRRLRAAVMAALTVFVVLTVLVFRTGSMQPMAWEDGLVTVQGPRSVSPDDRFGQSYIVVHGELPPHRYAGEALFLQLDSRITGTHTETIVEENGTETVYLQGMTRRSQAIRSGYEEYGEMVLYPVPDRVVYGFGNDQTLLWGAPRTGGAQVLPRLTLAYYLFFAAVALALSASAWLLGRASRFSPILRQITFAPLCYLFAHLFLKGTQTVTFFLLADLTCILLVAAALYALLTLGWQGLRKKRW